MLRAPPPTELTVSLSSQITLMWKINPVHSVWKARAIGSAVALKRLCWGNSFSILEFFFPPSQTPLTEREDQSCLPPLLIDPSTSTLASGVGGAICGMRLRTRANMNFRLARAYNLNVNSTISNASAVKAGREPHIRWLQSWLGKSLPFYRCYPSHSSASNLERRPEPLCLEIH